MSDADIKQAETQIPVVRGYLRDAGLIVHSATPINSGKHIGLVIVFPDSGRIWKCSLCATASTEDMDNFIAEARAWEIEQCKSIEVKLCPYCGQVMPHG